LVWFQPCLNKGGQCPRFRFAEWGWVVAPVKRSPGCIDRTDQETSLLAPALRWGRRKGCLVPVAPCTPPSGPLVGQGRGRGALLNFTNGRCRLGPALAHCWWALAAMGASDLVSETQTLRSCRPTALRLGWLVVGPHGIEEEGRIFDYSGDGCSGTSGIKPSSGLAVWASLGRRGGQGGVRPPSEEPPTVGHKWLHLSDVMMSCLDADSH
jgi:hypothetical protein